MSPSIDEGAGVPLCTTLGVVPLNVHASPRGLGIVRATAAAEKTLVASRQAAISGVRTSSGAAGVFALRLIWFSSRLQTIPS